MFWCNLSSPSWSSSTHVCQSVTATCCICISVSFVRPCSSWLPGEREEETRHHGKLWWEKWASAPQLFAGELLKRPGEMMSLTPSFSPTPRAYVFFLLWQRWRSPAAEPEPGFGQTSSCTSERHTTLTNPNPTEKSPVVKVTWRLCKWLIWHVREGPPWSWSSSGSPRGKKSSLGWGTWSSTLIVLLVYFLLRPQK